LKGGRERERERIHKYVAACNKFGVSVLIRHRKGLAVDNGEGKRKYMFKTNKGPWISQMVNFRVQ
jgi:hypothetical protein